ncbi:MAG: hypothetical protein PPP58_12370 [Natronomonas sp.]
MDPLDAESVTAPESRHNLHVTGEADLIDIGPWSSKQLYTAVEAADSGDDIVVLDYGRETLYLVGEGDVSYVPPAALGFAESPGLRVEEPRTYDPDSRTTGRTRVDSLVVSPEFDILVPAFDWEEPDEEWEPPELDYRERPSETSSGAIGG